MIRKIENENQLNKTRHQQNKESVGNKMFIVLKDIYTTEKKKKKERGRDLSEESSKKKKMTFARLGTKAPSQG